MGLFQGNKKPQKKPVDETSAGLRHFFEEYFQDLRSRGHLEFDELLETKKERFKQDLDATVARASDDLREHIADQLGRMFVENSKTMQEAQDTALQSLNQSAQELKDRHAQLSQELKQNITDQQAAITNVIDENKEQLAAVKEAQDTALQSLNQSAQELKDQQEKLGQTLQDQVNKRQEALVAAFEGNMAEIIEHYLLEALGEQYDLKAQLPSIIKQMEANKQATVDDMKL